MTGAGSGAGCLDGGAWESGEFNCFLGVNGVDLLVGGTHFVRSKSFFPRRWRAIDQEGVDERQKRSSVHDGKSKCNNVI